MRLLSAVLNTNNLIWRIVGVLFYFTFDTKYRPEKRTITVNFKRQSKHLTIGDLNYLFSMYWSQLDLNGIIFWMICAWHSESVQSENFVEMYRIGLVHLYSHGVKIICFWVILFTIRFCFVIVSLVTFCFLATLKPCRPLYREASFAYTKARRRRSNGWNKHIILEKKEFAVPRFSHLFRRVQAWSFICL